LFRRRRPRKLFELLLHVGEIRAVFFARRDDAIDELRIELRIFDAARNTRRGSRRRSLGGNEVGDDEKTDDCRDDAMPHDAAILP